MNRRAQSYSDFHHAVTSIFGADSIREDERRDKDAGNIKDDLDFADWYDGIEGDLLDASHDEYTYVERIAGYEEV